ncbi:MAG: AAA family ATPase, partial [Oscillospiraceae bacterium]|nr:AAA family ATPase [Oscillospiraceae bacterium]
MREIAFYGKGGIGKSTVCANLSAALSVVGRRVLQIGCDPKHDSTRLLTQGAAVTTALDYMRITNPSDYTLDEILFHGFGGIGCVEAGGPEPGVGCAGRGIISAFELLDRFNLKDNYDHIVYDVLGDVVCGGFAVPIRSEYANAVFIVTSGEFMSLYAANNILRGVRNFDNYEHRIAGIIFNKRNIPGEDEYVARFAEATALPICATIPRSEIFSESELLKTTVVAHDANHDVSNIFIDLARTIASDAHKLHEAKPLESDQLEDIVFARCASKNVTPCTPYTPTADAAIACAPKSVAPQHIAQADHAHYYSKNVMRGEPLHGCAFNGAMGVCVHIKGAVSLAHSPKNCAYITHQTITHTGLRTMRVQGALQAVSLTPDIECTEIGEAEVVFGGMEKLENKISEIKARSPRAIIVISSC